MTFRINALPSADTHTRNITDVGLFATHAATMAMYATDVQLSIVSAPKLSFPTIRLLLPLLRC